MFLAKKTDTIISFIIIIQLIISSIRMIIRPQNYLINGFLILCCPVIELIFTIYVLTSKKSKFINKTIIIPILFFSYMLIRHSFNLDIINHGASDIFIFSFCLFCLISCSEQNLIERFYLVCITLLYISIGIAVASYILKYLNFDVYSMSRFKGIMPHPNTLGHWVVYGLVFGFCTLLINPKKKINYILFIISFSLSINILIDTGSRASMLFFCISILGLIIAYFLKLKTLVSFSQKRLILIFIILIITCFISLAAFFVLSESFRFKVLDLLRIEYAADDSFIEIANSAIAGFFDGSSRDDLRASAIKSWTNNILWGLSTKEIIKDMPLSIRESDATHNTFLQILTTLGVIGFILFAIFYILGFVYLFYGLKLKNDKLKIISILSLILYIAILIDSNFENLLYTSQTIMTMCGYFIITMGYQIKHLFDEQQKSMAITRN